MVRHIGFPKFLVADITPWKQNRIHILSEHCNYIQMALQILYGLSIDSLLVVLKLTREVKTKRIGEKKAPLAAKFFWPRVNYSTRKGFSR